MRYLERSFSVPVFGFGKKIEISKCCNAPIRIEIRDKHYCQRRKKETTLWDICTKCGRPCEVEVIRNG